MGASSDPAQWPAAPQLDPDLEATSHTIRFSGADRYQTNLALNLALRGRGGYPFDTSDRTSGNAAALGSAAGWWGANTCPSSIIVVAGDTFADALAAASLSDPTDRSDQPRLRRTAAADPTFDLIGQFDRVETAAAPIVVTASARSGAKGLGEAARLSAADLSRGGCTSAREAVIVGGAAAVPVGAERELLDLGYREVFRVAGADRYSTAAQVARALGTEAVPDGATCSDPDVTDGTARLGFYANAAPEYRFDERSCIVLSRAVVLADGTTGADALAAGWWTSRWQVPVLLVDDEGRLPAATRGALQEMDIDTVIVLGGTARIPERSVDEAKQLADAVAGRIAGADRYATSVAMARAFGGWFPTGDGGDFGGDRLCVVGSAGAAVGWSDALALGPWCGRLSAGGRPNPVRALPAAFNGGSVGTWTVGGSQPSHDAVPILLLPAGVPRLPASTERFLTEAFAPATPWCQVRTHDDACVQPGFAVIAGGEANVPRSMAAEVGNLISGGLGEDGAGPTPALAPGFVTELEMAPVHLGPAATGRRFCVPHAGMRGLRWLSLQAPAFVGELDLLALDAYGETGSSRAVCSPLPTGSDLAVVGVSPTGTRAEPQHVPEALGEVLRLDGLVEQEGAFSADGSSWRSQELLGAPNLVHGTTAQQIRTATLDLTFTVRSDGTTGVQGVGDVITDFGAIRLRVDGGAAEVEGRQIVTGRASISTGAGQPGYTGGFRLELGDAGRSARWRFDGFPLAG